MHPETVFASSCLGEPAASTWEDAMARTDLFDGISEFLTVVRRGSFRAAARELGVTPGAVSQAVQTLERRIDDGNWRRIRVQCLSGRKPVRH